MIGVPPIPPRLRWPVGHCGAGSPRRRPPAGARSPLAGLAGQGRPGPGGTGRRGDSADRPVSRGGVSRSHSRPPRTRRSGVGGPGLCPMRRAPRDRSRSPTGDRNADAHRGWMTSVPVSPVRPGGRPRGRRAERVQTG
jgi:hypothetical protein